MCTIGYHGGLRVLFKNRDKSLPVEEEIVNTTDLLACRSRGADYYSWGLNRHGCGFAGAAVNDVGWTKLVYAGRRTEADAVHSRFSMGKTHPGRILTDTLPEVRQVEEWISHFTHRGIEWLAYNLLLVDREKAVVLEVSGLEWGLRPLDGVGVATNHFHSIAFGPARREDYPSSFRRLEYASDRLSRAIRTNDVLEALRPQALDRRRQIWRTGPFATVSSSVIDLEKGCAYHSSDVGSPYVCYSLGERKEV